MKDCEKYQEMISQMLDDELSTQQLVELNLHVKKCPECKAVYDAFTAVHGAVQTCIAEPPATLHKSIMDAVAASTEKPSAPKEKQGTLTRIRPLMNVAACLVVIAVALIASIKYGATTTGRSRFPFPSISSIQASSAASADADASAGAPAADSAPADELAGNSDSSLTSSAAGYSLDGEKAPENGANEEAPAAPEAAEAAVEESVTLDIASAVVTTESPDGTAAEALDATDAKVWLATLIESGAPFSSAGSAKNIGYTFAVTREGGDSYTVYFAYSGKKLQCSFSEDMSASAEISSLRDYESYIEGQTK